MFSADQLASFARDGFFTVPHFFDAAEVRLLQSEIDRLKQAGLLRNVSTDGDGTTHSQTKRNLQICPVSPHSEPFLALPYAEKVVNAITELIGSPAKVRLDQVFLKPAKDGAGTNWHQDNAYFRVADPMRGVAMWIAVHDATIANGTMHMLPGLQHEALPHSRDPDSDHHVRCYPDTANEVPCELAAGGVVFFAYGTPHCTKGNVTDADRAGLAYHFFHADFPPQDGANDDFPLLTSESDQRGRWAAFVG
jgi:ectoine hydroxylase-related dioxygenase (phytanoyl-CoA dioxygenase family)